jgi:hypothetical protein
MDIIKNLKKKVGYALIAASLLAASSIQGSPFSEEDDAPPAQNVEGILVPVVNVTLTIVSGAEALTVVSGAEPLPVVSGPESEQVPGPKFKFSFPQGYRLVHQGWRVHSLPIGMLHVLHQGWRVHSLPIDMLQIVLVPNNGGPKSASNPGIRSLIRRLMAQGLVRRGGCFCRIIRNVLVEAYIPEGFVATELPDGTIALFPKISIPVVLGDGDVILVDGKVIRVKNNYSVERVI